MKVPVYDPDKQDGESGGTSIWYLATVPEKDEHLLKDEYVSDSELIWHEDESHENGGYYCVHLVCTRSVTVADEYGDVLAVDMGAKWIACSVFLSDRDTEFHGRRVREHYKQLRKSLGKAKVRYRAHVIERIGYAEFRKVDDALHKVALEVIKRAEERNAVIVVGDLNGIRYESDEGRHVNNKTHKMPFTKMATYLTYKTRREGRVSSVDERDTSRMCWRCGSQNTSREVQGVWSVTSAVWTTMATRMVHRYRTTSRR